MDRAFHRHSGEQKTKSFHLRKIGKRIHHLISHTDGGDDDVKEYREEESDNIILSSETESQFKVAKSVMEQQNGEGGGPKPPKPQSEMEMMKERFSKLLLGEDMSGAGNGVSSALALSNAITNLAASVFGEQSRLRPMSEESKIRWKREVGWLLSVTDHIVELVPSQQIGKDGTSMEIMTTQQRMDLLMNVPVLRKLDAMLIDALDNFKQEQEFWYVSKNDDKSEGNSNSQSDKWWLPTVKVPADGLSESARKWMYNQRDYVTQVLKAAMAINAQVLSEMEIPDNYIESLPKNGRESLGESTYRCITEEFFDPGNLLDSMDLSSEHKVLDLKNRIEASIVIWKRKMNNKDSKSSWGSAVSIEKREIFEDRAETILLLIKQKFPGLPQSSLEISKIQYNLDVGQSILESYSRVIESLAYTVLSRIDDVLNADCVARNAAASIEEEKAAMESSSESQSMTLLDFMNWPSSNGREDVQRNSSADNEEDSKDDNETQTVRKPSKHSLKKSYWDKIEMLYAIKSPIVRH